MVAEKVTSLLEFKYLMNNHIHSKKTYNEDFLLNK